MRRFNATIICSKGIRQLTTIATLWLQTSQVAVYSRAGPHLYMYVAK